MASKKHRYPIAQQPVAQLPGLPAGYREFLEDLKVRIRSAQVKAALSANRELIVLYWDIGKSIVERQRAEGWGKSVVERLAADLQREFPGIGGFSAGNIWRMRAFYLAYTEEVSNLAQAARESKNPKLAQVARELDGRNLPQAASEIPWFHNVILIQRLKNPVKRLWYARAALEYGWSRDVLVHQIESGLYERQGKAPTNFKRTLPPPQSDLAQQTIKDPYTFDFLTISKYAREDARCQVDGIIVGVRPAHTRPLVYVRLEAVRVGLVEGRDSVSEGHVLIVGPELEELDGTCQTALLVGVDPLWVDVGDFLSVTDLLLDKHRVWLTLTRRWEARHRVYGLGDEAPGSHSLKYPLVVGTCATLGRRFKHLINVDSYTLARRPPEE